MSYREEYQCDRCDAQVVEPGPKEPRPFQIVIEEGEEPATYESFQRLLCSACEQELLVWIDESEVDRSDKADLPHVDRMSQTLEELGDEMQDLSEHLRKHNEDDGGS